MRRLNDYQRLMLSTFAMIGLMAAGYWLFITDDYTLTSYQVRECNKTLTVMVINSLGERRKVAFIPGEYHEHCLPKQDYLLANLDSGLDGGCACYVTCRGNQLIIHCREDIFLPTELSALIAAHCEKLNDDDLAAQALSDIPEILVE